MKQSQILKDNLSILREQTKTAIKNIVEEKQITFERPIIIAQIDDINEVIIGLRGEDLTLITEYNYDESEMRLDDLSIDLQLGLLEELEDGSFEEDFE